MDAYVAEKIVKNVFSAKYNCFFSDLSVYFQPLLGWECPYTWECPHTTKVLKKTAFTINCKRKFKKIGFQVNFILEIKLQKYIFYQNTTIFFVTSVSILNPSYGMLIPILTRVQKGRITS